MDLLDGGRVFDFNYLSELGGVRKVFSVMGSMSWELCVIL